MADPQTPTDVASFFTEGLTFSTPAWLVTFIIVALILFVVAIVVAVVVIRRVRYPWKVEIWRNVGHGPERVGKDRCREISMGNSGAKVIYFMKNKLFGSPNVRFVGNRQLYFYVGNDGLLHNTTFEDYEKKSGQLGFSPVDKHAKLTHVNVRSVVDANYKPGDWMEKYAGFVWFGLVFIMVIAIGIIAYFWFSRWQEISSAAQISIAESTKLRAEDARLLNSTNIMIESMKGLADRLASLQQGSGLKPG